ncbi:MAG: hypothetical protein M0023_16045, partial [Desulfobacteraceae bacterium]|nr:hypothetical protein [Desulfobacteraceae bacterium]
EFKRIDIIPAAYFRTVSVACDASIIFSRAVTKGIIGGPRLIITCDTEGNKRHKVDASLDYK